MFIVCAYLYKEAAASRCVHPPYAEQNKTALYRKIFKDFYLGRWTYNTIPEYRKNAYFNKERLEAKSTLGHLVSEQANVFQYRIAGESKCRKHRTVSKDSDISSRSTCPWYHVLDFDMQREPQAIAKAKCSCKHCLSVNRNGNTTNRCKEINTYVPVIKWSCPLNYEGGNNYFQYYIHLETVPVGCTCKTPNYVQG